MMVLAGGNNTNSTGHSIPSALTANTLYMFCNAITEPKEIPLNHTNTTNKNQMFILVFFSNTQNQPHIYDVTHRKNSETILRNFGLATGIDLL